MSIFPLPQFEADLEADRKVYESLKPPTSIVVRFGAMRMVGEFPYSGAEKPGCGSKVVVRTHRGLEVGEMLTSTCPNAGCSKSVTRQEMLEYIEASGGPEYPFHTDGRVVRIATVDDVQRQSSLDASRKDLVRDARAVARDLDLPMKIVDAEPILGGEVLTLYFTSEQRIDFRELARRLAESHRTRIELRQVGARDEARLTADYERCGQHCCCKQFLKVLKPISMRSAKVQKSTLDPLKISGRCGRLMCCLRYEDETYESLRKRLPHRGVRVGTPEGPGHVIDTQILTQLVLVALEAPDAGARQIAVPVESLCDPDAAPPPKPQPDPLRGMSPERVERRARPTPEQRSQRTPAQQQDDYRRRSQREDRAPQPPAPPEAESPPARPPAPAPQQDRPRDQRRRPRTPPNHDPQRDDPRPAPTDSAGEQTPRPPHDQGDDRSRRRRGRRGRGRGRSGPPGASPDAPPPPQGPGPAE